MIDKRKFSVIGFAHQIQPTSIGSNPYSPLFVFKNAVNTVVAQTINISSIMTVMLRVEFQRIICFAQYENTSSFCAHPYSIILIFYNAVGNSRH